MRIALYQPDQAGNVGTILRLAACLGTPVDLIEPCRFPFSDRALKRAGMDYAAIANVTRHGDWEAFLAAAEGRLVLFTTKAERSYLDETFTAADVLLFGRESAGVPEEVHAAADVRLTIPMRPGMRSLNVAMAAAMAAGEALRQMGPQP